MAVFAALLLAGCGRTVATWPQTQTGDIARAEADFYIENSGSMDGFMHDGAELKDAVFGYATAMSKYVSRTRLYYTNSRIIPVSVPMERLSRALNVESFRRGGGDRSSTDLPSMLRMVIGHSAERGHVAVFVSDCILAPPEGSARNFFVNCQISTEAIVARELKRHPDLTFVAYRLMSHFSGRFYNSRGATTISGPRPYYMIVIGKRALVCQLMRKAPLEDVPGARVTCSVAYTGQHVPQMAITNTTGREPREGSCTLLPDKGTRGLRFKLLADLTSSFLPEKVLMNAETYKVSDRRVKVEYVERIDDAESPFTHVLTLSAPGALPPGEVRVSLLARENPRWIDEANDDTGTFIGRKTTGIKYLLYGIRAAYDEGPAATMKFTIKRD